MEDLSEHLSWNRAEGSREAASLALPESGVFLRRGACDSHPYTQEEVRYKLLIFLARGEGDAVGMCWRNMAAIVLTGSKLLMV